MDRDFLSKIAIEYRLSAEQTEAFVSRFDPANLGESEAKLSGELNIGVSTFKKRMTQAYKKLQPLCPELASTKRGKLEKLRAALLHQVEQREAGTKFDKLREEKRSPQSKKAANQPNAAHPPPQQGEVQKPEHFYRVLPLPPRHKHVERPQELAKVKQLVLYGKENTTVISGLGGQGKSTLAAAIAHDPEIWSHFPDGVLWVTLGQQANNIQSQLNGWIHELDKSPDSYSATTQDSAKDFLGRLLEHKRMLLVIDDVWNSPNAEWFRVGGANCRVLITTRTAVIPNSKRHILPAMSAKESIALIKAELDDQWVPSMKEPAQEFAELLGRLPLALKLMAVQIRRGIGWENLKQAFLQERKRLKAFNQPGVKLDQLSEDEQRECSLRACFALSLKWLEPELLERFIWLGVLPEDSEIQTRMATTLWQLENWEAEETLLSLSENSLLIASTQAFGGEPTYRIHDLLHVLAQELVENSTQLKEAPALDTLCSLPGLGITLIEAQGQFLNRCGIKPGEEWWHQLSDDDGYLYQHLTWHIEQAGWGNEIHKLMAASDKQGRNLWFKTCDRLGKIEIFSRDLITGWRLADALETGKSHALALNCRYALLRSTLNSLVKSLPPEVIAEFLKQKHWSWERALSYANSLQGNREKAIIIQKTVPYITSEKALYMALDYLKNSSETRIYIETLISLSKNNKKFLLEGIDLLSSVENKYYYAIIMARIAKQDSTYWPAALEAALSIKDSRCIGALVNLAKQSDLYVDIALEAVKNASKRSRGYYFSQIAKINPLYLDKAVLVIRSVDNLYDRANALIYLAEIDSSFLEEALEVIDKIKEKHKNIDEYAFLLSRISMLDSTFFKEALSAISSCKMKYRWPETLANLSKVKPFNSSAIEDISTFINDNEEYANSLLEITRIDSKYLTNVIELIRTLGIEEQSMLWVQIAETHPEYFDQALEFVLSLHDFDNQAYLLSRLSIVNPSCFAKALELTRNLENGSGKVYVFCILISLDCTLYDEILNVLNSLNEESLTIFCLKEIASKSDVPSREILNIIRQLSNEGGKVDVLCELRNINEIDFQDVLDVVDSLKLPYGRARALIGLTKRNDSRFLSHALREIDQVEDNYRKASLLVETIELDPAKIRDVMSLVEGISSQSCRADILIKIVHNDASYYELAFNEANLINSESQRLECLSELGQVAPPRSLSVLTRSIISSSERNQSAKALRCFLTRQVNLSFKDWKSILHVLAYGSRADLMKDISRLAPAIISLEEEGLKEVVDVMSGVCHQWP